jgi:phosphotransacetylase
VLVGPEAKVRAAAEAEQIDLSPYPTLEDKRDIVQNAIGLAHVLGIAGPRVAILSAV